MQKLLPLAVLVAILIGVFAFVQNANKPLVDIVREETTDLVSVTWCLNTPDVSETECYEPVEVAAGSSAYESLVALDNSDASFSFQATDYGSELGHFVTEVNGIAGDETNFWKLFYNNAEAQTGIDQIEVQDNDRLEFRFEEVTF